ncbi:hypothetical protein MO973_09890 [Paenibacillus sp. TRM 82003]|uniref:hypothetical protein n=1 Tax=Kineococcus sp. TRM81007 TaxID=2925831 RepID=UPI001F59FB0F|nr:hypothetical protein [Kineococcus sp. TRM81007]MCI2238159.1 hypothetical protein [Kineococcus sp. TRM81007]MCI3920543.1 hypothetical protein [Paenibacillus sp. TRM 82003]
MNAARTGTSTGVVVLLVAGDTAPADDPVTRFWVDVLERTGCPHEVHRPTAARPLLDTDLVAADGTGRFGAIVRTTTTAAGVEPASAAALSRYRDRYGVRLLRAYEFPDAASGLRDVSGGSADGLTARVTAAGAAVFGYLGGEVPVAGGCWAYLGRAVAGGPFTPLLVTTGGAPLAGVVDAGDGLEDLLVLVNTAEDSLHGALLARGLLAWVTRGAHLGAVRHALSCHVDDVFLPNWSVPGVRVGETAPTVRMVPADVDAVVAWQEATGFTLDLAHNAAGASGDDPLTAALLVAAGAFRWLNHTWDHRDLDAVDADELRAQVERNRRWADEAGVPASPTALVTGAHSGLRNPALPGVLAAAGITALASDASRGPGPGSLGPATLVPRHPTEVTTHVSTWPQLLADQERLHGAPAPSREEFLDRQGDVVLGRVLAGDPRPLFAHQSNLTGDRVLLDLLQQVLDRWARLLAPCAPLDGPSMDEVARELGRRRRWREALDAGAVRARTDGAELLLAADVDVEFPVTLPAGAGAGDAYAGARCGWLAVEAGRELAVPLGAA